MPPAASWSVPISVGVDQLRPYTAYLFEVSAFTSDGEGQIASTMVRMPESGVDILWLVCEFECAQHKHHLLHVWNVISVPFSPRRPATKLLHFKYNVSIDLRVLELSQHHHRKIHLHALPLWTYRLLNTLFNTLAYMHEQTQMEFIFILFFYQDIYMRTAQETRDLLLPVWARTRGTR